MTTDINDKIDVANHIKGEFVVATDKKVDAVVINDKKDEVGVAKIKAEYLIKDYHPVVDTEYISDTVKKQIDNAKVYDRDNDGPPCKRIKLKGRNSQRPKGRRVDASDKLCPSYMQDKECSYGDRCKFSHNKSLFMANKSADIATVCYLFETYGKCPYGITCRFAKSHISDDLKNIISPVFKDMKDRESFVRNVLKKDLQVSLWKRRYDFSKSDEALGNICPSSNNQKKRDTQDCKKRQSQNSNKTADFKKCEGNTEKSTCESNKKDDLESVNGSIIGENKKNDTTISAIMEEVEMNGNDINVNKACSDIDNIASNAGVQSLDKMPDDVIDSETMQLSVATHCTEDSIADILQQEKKKINFTDKLYLAPLTTVGNLPFRRICKRYGADITCSEMAVSTNLLQGQQSEWALLKRHVTEDRFGVQLCGGYPDSMTRCAQLICENMDVDFIDINCGCPIDLIYNKGEGSALMGRLNKFEHIVKGMLSVMDVPLTVKIRTGIYDNKNIAHTIVPKLRDWGVSLTTLHGRSRMQRYTKTADWDYISECAHLASPMPVYGNGDILSYEEANLHRQQTGISGIMIARGALIKPWIFTEIKEQRHWDISSSERFDILKDYANYGLDHWGSDTQGVENTRRFMLEWLSFLYRYIPVGVLERVPQLINERPPYFRGRDDMETLMASPNCGDWIKISEMLLGPVPEGFTFLPKHKANAYK